jgi:hypothetical protein
MESEHAARVRRICMGLPGTIEKLSHGEPTWFVNKRTYAMFDNNHHGGGHIAVWIPAEPGAQELLIHSRPKTYFRPPYVGVKGWVGIELTQIDDDELAGHLTDAWRLIGKDKAPRKKR